MCELGLPDALSIYGEAEIIGKDGKDEERKDNGDEGIAQFDEHHRSPSAENQPRRPAPWDSAGRSARSSRR
jgi:hypothetical protein